VIGGAGHVGLPLALTFANAGLRTVIYDTNRPVLEKIAAGEMPFMETGGDELLRRVNASGTLELSAEPGPISECEFLVVIIGTPVDEHLNPNLTTIRRVLDQCRSFLRDGQTIILRSTVVPGMTEHIQRYVASLGLEIDVAFCPERVAQGKSLEEFTTLPQIISAVDPATLVKIRALFAPFTAEFIELQPREAEMAKLMTNAWRYIQFATVNQFYTLATADGLDFERILHACRHNYPRMQGMPSPGLTAGPCLMKDTMQLAAFSRDGFVLGHAAMMVNEGLPSHLVSLAKRRTDLATAAAGILGMAFKAGSDDPRDSLSYKLRKILMLEARSVLCTDPYVRDSTLVPLERTIAEADVLFVATPHPEYRDLNIPEGKIVIDVWNIVGGGARR
jgi:UDP-N-acetyl-D-mannosaminuronic acid dehydrogenase